VLVRDADASSWKVTLELLGVAGGIAAFLYAVGGFIFALRLRALGLPIDATVALLPTSLLLVTAIRTLGLSLLIAVIATVGVRWLNPAQSVPRRWILFLSTSTLVVVVAGSTVLWEPMTAILRGLIGLASAVILYLLARRLMGAVNTRKLALQLGCGALLFLLLRLAWVAAFPPTPMDFVSVRMNTGDLTDGYYLAADDSNMYLVLNVSKRSIGVISVIPRGDISAFKFRREETPIWPLDQDLPAALVGPFARPLFLDPSGLAHDLLERAAVLRRGPQWVYPPIVPYKALRFLSTRLAPFSAQSLEEIPPDGVPSVSLASVLSDPALYPGRDFRTQGIVRSATMSRPLDGGLGRWYVVLEVEGDEGPHAGCFVAVPDSSVPQAGTSVEVHATVLAFGSTRTVAGDPIPTVELACAGIAPSL
jgi:hypothetical protein